jgi:antitoxin VapB
MSETGFAKLFKHDVVRPCVCPWCSVCRGDRVRVRRVGHGILLEPIVTDIDAWFAELDRFGEVPFMEKGRRQPPMPEAEQQPWGSGLLQRRVCAER